MLCYGGKIDCGDLPLYSLFPPFPTLISERLGTSESLLQERGTGTFLSCAGAVINRQAGKNKIKKAILKLNTKISFAELLLGLAFSYLFFTSWRTQLCGLWGENGSYFCMFSEGTIPPLGISGSSLLSHVAGMQGRGANGGRN